MTTTSACFLGVTASLKWWTWAHRPETPCVRTERALCRQHCFLERTYKLVLSSGLDTVVFDVTMCLLEGLLNKKNARKMSKF